MSKSESSAIRVTLTMSKDTARSVLSILEGALEEGDRNLVDNPELFDKFTVDFHNEMKANITAHVLDPIHAEFPKDVGGPLDLVGHKVFFPMDHIHGEYQVEGLVIERDPNNSAHVIIVDPNRTGSNKFSVHWLQCRADHLHIMG